MNMKKKKFYFAKIVVSLCLHCCLVIIPTTYSYSIVPDTNHIGGSIVNIKMFNNQPFKVVLNGVEYVSTSNNIISINNVHAGIQKIKVVQENVFYICTTATKTQATHKTDHLVTAFYGSVKIVPKSEMYIEVQPDKTFKLIKAEKQKLF